jgi:uncharacterized protein
VSNSALRQLIIVAVAAALHASGVFAQTAEPSSPFDGMPVSKIKTLAKAGDDEARMALAEAYESGRDVEQDLAEAARWYREAGLQGNLEARFRFARLAMKGAPNLRQDTANALKLYEDAAGKGHAASQNALGLLYLNGTGVAKDEKKAFELFTASADQNFAEAENNLGLMYLRGIATNRDADKAFTFLKRGADKGDGWALNNLAALYEKGWGVTQDIQKARALYEQALAKGIMTASKNLQRIQSTPAN